MWKSHWGLERDPFAESDATLCLAADTRRGGCAADSCDRNRRAPAVLTRRCRAGKEHRPAQSICRDEESAAAICPGELCPRRKRFCSPSWRSVWASASGASRAGWLRGGLSSARSGWRRFREFTWFSASTTASSRARTCGATSSRSLKSAAGTSTHSRSSSADDGRERASDDRWTLAIGLESLTRSEAELISRRNSPRPAVGKARFTPRAVTRLHCLCGGFREALQQLATRCLMAGAARASR